MEIRTLAQEDDRRAVSRVYEQSWRHAYAGIVPEDYLDAIPCGRWADVLDTPGRHSLLCIVEGEIVGTSSFSASRYEQFGDAGEVISLYVLPEYAGKGYGTALLRAALAGLQGLGFDEAFLWVLEDNAGARRFYERFGLTCTEDYLGTTIGGRDLREVRYVYHRS